MGQDPGPALQTSQNLQKILGGRPPIRWVGLPNYRPEKSPLPVNSGRLRKIGSKPRLRAADVPGYWVRAPDSISRSFRSFRRPYEIARRPDWSDFPPSETRRRLYGEIMGGLAKSALNHVSAHRMGQGPPPPEFRESEWNSRLPAVLPEKSRGPSRELTPVESSGAD